MPEKTIKGTGRVGLADTASSETWRQRLRKEEAFTASKNRSDLQKIGDRLYMHNTYLALFKKEEEVEEPKPVQFMYDRAVATVDDFCQKCDRDSSRCLHKRGKKDPKEVVASPLTAAHEYGWRHPIDNPKLGYDRTSICRDTFFNRGHLNLSS